MKTGFEKWVTDFLSDWKNPVGLLALALVILLALVYWNFTRIMLKSLRRNLLRSILTSVVIFVLVFIVTGVLSVLNFLSEVTTEKSKNFKLIITEKHQLPSQMPFGYAGDLEGYAADPRDSMTWQFLGATVDKNELTPKTILFFFCMEPKKLITLEKDGKYSSMMDGIDEFTEEQQRQLTAACEEMEKTPNKVVIGQERLDMLNKKVGERIKVYSFNYVDIEMELEILGALPAGRYGQSAVMNRSYLIEAMNKYEREKKQRHPMFDRSLNLVWLRVPDRSEFEKVAESVSASPKFKTPAVKCETASSGISSFLDAYRDLLWGMRWLFVPANLVTMALVIAIAISLSVRERRTEMAVMKVLGFTPNMVLMMVLGEALLLGALSGFLSAVGTKLIINDVVGGIKFPIAFFPAFKIADAAPWWGLAIGVVTALAGSFLPAWSARSVKVSEVFAKIA